MFTRDEEIRRFADELMQISFDRMTDSSYGWFGGYPKPYGLQWKMTEQILNNEVVISAGAQLTAALSLLRMSEITDNKIYRSRGTMLGEQLLNSAWDTARGGWFDIIKRKPPFEPQDTSTVYWWLQSYGMFLQLHLYHITGEQRYLDHYKKMAAFWNDCFVDEKWGGVYLNVTPSGGLQTTDKAQAWKASYHEMENALLNYLYLNLYVNSKPAILFFHIKDSPPGSKHFVSPAEDPSVQITGVRINGKQWNSFDAAERSVNLPEGNDLRLEVTLGKNLKH
jgi:mannose/cellobiose epimerase-like protein (N-acyl-D-glucosamine 2-epimerase family)